MKRPDALSAMRRGEGCVICPAERVDDPGRGLRFHAGEWVDAYAVGTSSSRRSSTADGDDELLGNSAPHLQAPVLPR